MSDRFRVIALISAFNEEDIISPVIGHLVENDVEVYLLDNHSTDRTVEEAAKWLGRGLLEVEPFPPHPGKDSAVDREFHWGEILDRKEDLSRTLGADWFIHHDADEFRESPWPGMNLKQAIQWVDGLGYNCINFRVLNFPPTDNAFRSGDDPRTHFSYCEDGLEVDRLQVKAWKASKTVSLSASGGHDVALEGKHVFPVPFLLRHYPVRSQSHGLRKVFHERKNRFLERERAQGWHVQYDTIHDAGHHFIREPTSLRLFDLEKERLALMMPEALISALDVQLQNESKKHETLAADNQSLRQHATNLEGDLQSLKQHAADLEADRDSTRQHVAALEANCQKDRQSLAQNVENLKRELSLLKQHAANLERDRDAARQHAANVERARETDRESLEQHAATLEKERESLRQHAAKLEKDRLSTSRHAANLEHEYDALQQHVANLEKDCDAARQHAASVERAREKDRESLEQHAATLEKERDSLRQHVANLEKDRDAFRQHAADVEQDRDSLRQHLANVEKDRQSLRAQAEEAANAQRDRGAPPRR